ATPEADSEAPPVAEELSHPRRGAEGGFEQGQAITPPAPGSHRLAKPVAARSRTNTSQSAFVSPATRSVAGVENATQRPSAEIEGEVLEPSAWSPPLEMLARSVVSLWRSRTKTSPNPFRSPETRLVAVLTKATLRPSAEIQGHELIEFPCAPPVATLASSVVPLTRSRTKTSSNPFTSPATRF